MTFHLRQLSVVELPLAARFYKQCGQRISPGREERVFLLNHEQATVAAVRLQPMADNWQFLRSMTVSPQCRREGVGSQMLRLLSDHLQPRTYCFPFDYLESFYQSGGFQLTSIENLPHFARDAFLRYRSQGRKIIAMTYN